MKTAISLPDPLFRSAERRRPQAADFETVFFAAAASHFIRETRRKTLRNSSMPFIAERDIRLAPSASIPRMQSSQVRRRAMVSFTGANYVGRLAVPEGSNPDIGILFLLSNRMNSTGCKYRNRRGHHLNLTFPRPRAMFYSQTHEPSPERLGHKCITAGDH